MSKIIQTDTHPKALWPVIKLIFEASYDPEKAAELETFLASKRKPLTRWQKFKRPFAEAGWRIRVAFDVLKKGDYSNYLDRD